MVESVGNETQKLSIAHLNVVVVGRGDDDLSRVDEGSDVGVVLQQPPSELEVVLALDHEMYLGHFCIN